MIWKTLLVLLCVMFGSSSAWAAGYTRTLNENLEVSGYKAKAFYNFQTNTPAVLPTSGDLRYRDGNIWGLHNFGSGQRSATATIPVASTDILVIQEYDSKYVTTINRGTENTTLTASTGYRVFDIKTTGDNVTFTVPRYGGIVAAFVMEKDNEVTTADYTINYIYNGSTIKTTNGNTAVGTVVEAENPIKVDDVKYYIKDGETTSMTIVEGTNTLNVNLRKANKEAYTVNLVNAKNEEEILVADAFQGEIVEGESSPRIYYHKAILVGEVWYVRNQNSSEPYYGMDVVAGTNTLSYTASSVNYFFEVEDLPVVKVGNYSGWRNDGLANRSSNGQAPRHYNKNYAYTDELEGGVYTLVMNARNCSSSVSDNITLAYMDGSGNIINLDTQFEAWAKAQTAEKSVSVSIPDGAKFVLKCGDSNSNLNMDFLMFTKTAELSISPEIGATGYRTFASDNALDFTAGNGVTGVKAYYASGLDNNKVVLQKITGTVKAGTGIFLSKDGDDAISIPVVADGESLSDNKFVRGPGKGYAVISEEGCTKYVLGVKDDDVSFFRINEKSAVIDTDKAYLQIEGSSSARLSIVFADEEEENDATGISSVAAQKQNDGVYYNLSGQRVNMPAKGLYIQNGKKVIVK